MLFVLEGCDGSGKTTVATNLKNILPGAEIVHCTTDTPNDFDFFMRLIRAARDRHIIADRFCYGQFVYQTAEERHLTPGQLNALETEMLANNVQVIHVTASVDEIENRLAFRGEKTTLPVGEICDRYLDLFENKTLIKPYLWWTGEDV
jgi:thymidylate kinase